MTDQTRENDRLYHSIPDVTNMMKAQQPGEKRIPFEHLTLLYQLII